MKKLSIPVLNDEYSIMVYIGKKEELIAAASKYLGLPKDVIEERTEDTRGSAWDALILECKKNVLILVDGDLPIDQAIATLAHEACHAADYIIEHTSIDDRKGEFRAHTIGAVIRNVYKLILNKKK